MGVQYWTIPYVAISDWRLALLYYVGAGLVGISAFVSTILQQRYLDKAEVVGTADFRLHNPDGPFFALDKLPYCQEQNVSCAEWDAEHISTHHSTHGSLFVRTYIQDKHETSSCMRPNCVLGFTSNHTDQFYVAGVEEFILEFKSHVKAAKWEKVYCNKGAECPYAGTTKRSHGRLIGKNGETVKEAPAGEKFRFPISTWLQAAGVALDDVHSKYTYHHHTMSGKTKRKKTSRQMGMELHIHVIWSNPGSLWQHARGHAPLEYQVEVNEVGAAYRRELLNEVRNASAGTQHRVLRKNYGMAFTIDREGTAGVFSLSEFLSQVGNKAALLGIIAAVLDVMWQYVFPLFGIDYNTGVFDKVTMTKDGRIERDASCEIKFAGKKD